MALFLATFVNKIDKKGRVSVPAPFRAALSTEGYQGIVAFRSYKNAAIDASGISRMEKLSSSIDEFDAFSDTQDDLTATIFADCQQLPIDGDGRIIIPKPLLEHAKITNHIAFVGRGPTFQMWHPATFEEHQLQARNRVKDQGLTIKLNKDCT
jgi:MraZ protein